MKPDDKQLLLKDLCARLPYSPICHIVGENGAEIDDILTTSTIQNLDVWVVKPYLRHMSSMTEEEKKELLNHVLGGKGVEYFHIAHDGSIDGNQAAEQDLYNLNLCWISFDPLTTSSYLDWLNSHHFDYRGLIEKDLAISTEVFNPYKD